MTSIVPGNRVPAFGLLCACALGAVAQAGDANLNMVFTTTDAGGSYGDRHVHVVWLETAAGQFVCTVGSSTSSTARAVWANSRASSLRTWWDANPERSQDVDARTGATQTAYRTYTVDWNWRTRGGAVVPDGTYRLRFLCTNADSGTPNNSATFSNVTKGGSPWSVGPTSTGGYNNVRLAFTPATLGVSNAEATNVTESTATLNGSVDGTGGSNPSVFIYWGDEDGGTDAAAWDDVIALGTRAAGPFAADVSGLVPGTTYYFRCYVQGSTGVWAAQTASFKAVSTTVVFEEGDTWRYFKGYSTPAGWNTRDFDASGWLTGESGFGYGDGDDNTELTDMRNHYWSVYLRFEFVVDEPAEVEKLTFTVDYDDGFAAYINGGAVARQNLAEGASYNTPASSHEAGAPVTLDLTAHRSRLAAGRNVFAIEVHNTTLDSSDLSMIPELMMVGGMRPPQGDIALSAAVLDFGEVGVGRSADLSFYVENTGNAALHVQSIGLAGLDKGSYRVTAAPVLPATLAASGGKATVTVRFSPGGAQDYRYAQAVVGSDDPDEPVAGAALRGGGGPGAAVALNAVGGVGGPCRAVAALTGSRVVAGQGAVLTVLETGGGSELRAVGQARLPGGIVGVAVSGDAAYAALGAGGIAVVDVGDPSRPLIVGRLPSMGHTYAVSAAGGRLCSAEGVGGMLCYDISDALAPAAAKMYETDGPAADVVTDGGLAYVLDERSGLSVFDLASPGSAPTGVCAVEFGRALAIAGTRAYVIDRLGGLFVIDISQPAAPTLVGSEIRLSAAGHAIAISGSRGFVTSDAGVEVLDLTNSDAPLPLGVVGVAGELADIAADDSEVYVAAGGEGLRLWDIPGVAAATEVSAYALQAAPHAVAANGALGEVWTADALGVAALDVSAVREPALLWVSGPAQARDIAISGNMIYVAAGTSGVQMFERIDAENVAWRGEFATDGFAVSVAVRGSIAAAADGVGVYVLDVSNPSTPALLGRWVSDGWAGGVAIDSNYVYAANGGRGVTVLSAADAAVVRTIDTAGVAGGIAAVDGKAYVANGTGGLAVYDVSSLPAAPVRLGYFDTPGIATDVTVVGARACVADGTGGVSIVDVSNPTAPLLYARNTDLVRSLSTAEAQSRLLAADDSGGLAILAAQAWPGRPFGDLDGDHAVILGDLIHLAGNWLESETLLDVLVGNLNDDTTVNLADFAVMADNWMAEQAD